MKKISFDEALIKISQEMFNTFYQKHTHQECLVYFNISERTFRKLLLFWNIEKKNKKLTDIDYDKEFIEKYYYSHTINECLKFFNISGASFYKLLDNLQIKSAQEVNKNKLMQKVSRDELYDLYINNNCSVRYCAKYFDISIGKINELLYWYQIENKTIDQKNSTRKNTDLLKYGMKHSSQSKEVKNKVFNTKLKLYGDGTFTNIEKAKKTNLSKYGFEYITQVPEIRTKIHNTIKIKYGVDAYPQTFEYHRKATKKYYYNDISFDSFPELAIYLYAIDHNIQVKRLPVKLTYEYMGKIHNYFPDFLYDGKLLEVKNDYLFSKMLIPNTIDNAKYNCILNNNIIIWTSTDYSFAIKYFKSANYNLNDFTNKKEK